MQKVLAAFDAALADVGYADYIGLKSGLDKYHRMRRHHLPEGERPLPLRLGPAVRGGADAGPSHPGDGEAQFAGAASSNRGVPAPDQPTVDGDECRVPAQAGLGEATQEVGRATSNVSPRSCKPMHADTERLSTRTGRTRRSPVNLPE
jgi:hypothetical protein